jgi:hypothetical protein
MNFVNRLLAGNPQLRNNPMAHNALSAIQNGDDATGEQIARNLCESYGITPEEAYAQAMRFFRGR